MLMGPSARHGGAKVHLPGFFLTSTPGFYARFQWQYRPAQRWVSFSHH